MIRLLLMAAAAATCFDVAPRSGRFNPATAKLVATLITGHGGAVTSIDLTPDGSRMVTSTVSGATFWDGRSRKKIREFEGVFFGQIVRLTPDGTRAIGLGRDRTTLRVMDTARGIETASISNVWAFTTPFALSPDGKSVVACLQDRSVRLYSVATGEERAQPVAPSARPTGSLSISPDGKLLGVIGWDGSVRVISIERAEEIMALEPGQDRNGALVFSPDSKSFLVTGPDRKIRRFDIAAGKSTVEFPEAALSPRAFVFLPDGTGIAAGDTSGNLLFWDAATGKEVARIASQQGAIHSLTFTPDGRQLMTGGADGTVRIWGTPGVARKIDEKPRIGKPGYLGIRPAPAEAGVTGVKLGEVMADTAAAKAGLQVGDVITHIGEKAVNTFEEMRGVLGGRIEGDELEIFYRRGDDARTTTVKLGARPTP